jgi:hypothetical protein
MGLLSTEKLGWGQFRVFSYDSQIVLIKNIDSFYLNN